MKKTLSALLVGSMLMFPLPALAADDTDTIHSLTFDTLDEEMTAHSPLILNMGDSVSENYSDLDENIKKLKDAKDKLSNSEYKPQGYVTGMTMEDVIKKAPLPMISLPTPTDTQKSDQDLLNYINSEINYINLTNFVTQVTSLQTQIDNLEKSRDNMWKSWLQVEQGKDQTIRGAQQIYLSYYSLYEQKDNLSANLSLLQKQLSSLQLKESLGMATHLQVIEVESQIKDLNMALDQLNKGLDSIKGQLNVFLGQDFDTSLQLKEPSNLSQSKINAMDYEEDLEDALVQSYTVRLEDDSDKREDAERNFTLAFHNAYQDVQDKKKALDLERYKLANAKTKYDQAVLMNSLGLLSNLDVEGARSQYTPQVNNVDTAEQDLLQAYTAYDWMKQGLTISSTASAASQSTGAPGTSGAAMGAGF